MHDPAGVIARPRPPVEVLGVRVDAVTQDELNHEIAALVDNHARTYLAYANIHAINIAQRDRLFRDFLNASPLVYCDGEGVRLGARLLGRRLPQRIVLTYWIWDLCEFIQARGYSIFLLGSTETAVCAAADRLRARFPRLTIAGTHHGFFAKSGSESDDVVRKVNDARPNILFVCFGMPLQEHWVRENLDRLNADVILFGGSTIDYTAGLKKVAPRWMCAGGLEWLFRLAQEPARLWKRYLIGNPAFLFAVIGQRLGWRPAR